MSAVWKGYGDRETWGGRDHDDANTDREDWLDNTHPADILTYHEQQELLGMVPMLANAIGERRDELARTMAKIYRAAERREWAKVQREKLESTFDC